MILWMIASLAALIMGGLLSDQALETETDHGPLIEAGGLVLGIGGLLSTIACIITVFCRMAP